MRDLKMQPTLANMRNFVKHTIGKTEFTYKEGQKYIKIIST